MGFSLKSFAKSWEHGGWYTSKGRRVMQGKTPGYESAETVLDRRAQQQAEYLDRVGGMDEYGVPRGFEPPPAEIAPGLQFAHERTCRQSMPGLRLRGFRRFPWRIRHTRTQHAVRTSLIVMSRPRSQN